MSDYTPQLQALMRSRQILSFKQLSEQTGISEKQIRRLRRGEIQAFRLSDLHKLSHGLGVAIADLISTFDSDAPTPDPPTPDLKQEYDRLQRQLTEQRQTLQQEFQQESLQILEPWLIQWSAAAHAAQQNPQAPAVKLLPLLRPIEQLIQHWGIEATAIVGSEIPYDPQQHQLMGGTAEPGQLVRVRYAGYRQGDRLLYRAKVSPL